MASHIVPEVCQHLFSVTEDPTKPLDEVLLRKVDARIAESLNDAHRIQILGAVQVLLPTLQQDATPATSLVMRLVTPKSVKFDQIDALLTQNGSSNDQYTQGLESLDKDVNLLTLNMLDKAAASPSDIGLVASKVEVVKAWIKLWLNTSSTAVAEEAANVLEKFLMYGIECDQATVENNLMVRRLFRDRDIYESIFSFCSLKTLGGLGQPDAKQKTIAQARLLEFLVRIDHSGSPIRASQVRDVERFYDVVNTEEGLLSFAFTKMVDNRDDDLMLSTLIENCAKYLVRKDPKSNERSGFALAFLKGNELHHICLSYFLDPVLSHGPWLLGDAIRYLRSYCSVWRDDLIGDEDLYTTILATLTRQFKNATKAEWHSSQVLHLNLLALETLPKSLHLLHLSTDDAPLMHLPTDTSNDLVIDVLARIFCTIHDYDHLTRQAAKMTGWAEKISARVLYFEYYKRHPELWSEIIRLADTVALTKSALAAIEFMDLFVSADWAPVDKEVVPSLPSEAELSRMRAGVAAPASGLEAMLFERGVAEIVLPYLLSPPTSFSVGRQARSTFDNSEDPAETVAKAKSQLTTHILDRLKGMERTPEIQQILEVFTRQVEANTRIAPTRGSGASVATMRR